MSNSIVLPRAQGRNGRREEREGRGRGGGRFCVGREDIKTVISDTLFQHPGEVPATLRTGSTRSGQFIPKAVLSYSHYYTYYLLLQLLIAATIHRWHLEPQEWLQV